MCNIHGISLMVSEEKYFKNGNRRRMDRRATDGQPFL